MADTQRNSAQGGKSNGKVANWPPIQSGERIDLVNRLNWLGKMVDLFRLATIQPGEEDGVFVSDANITFQYKSPDALEKSLNTEAGVAGGGGGGGGGTGDAWVWKGQWTDTNYDLGDVVIRETSAELIDGTVASTYLALVQVTTGTVAPGAPGSSAVWARIARGNWDYLRIGSGANTFTMNPATDVEHQIGTKNFNSSATGFRVGNTGDNLHSRVSDGGYYWQTAAADRSALIV